MPQPAHELENQLSVLWSLALGPGLSWDFQARPPRLPLSTDAAGGGPRAAGRSANGSAAAAAAGLVGEGSDSAAP